MATPSTPPPLPSRITTPRKHALIVDLNGVLIYRTQTKIESAKIPHHNIRGKYVYIRPGAKEFLDVMSEVYALYICTSMTERNAIDCLKCITQDYTAYIRSIMHGVKYNTKDTRAGTQEWDTVRNIAAIMANITPHTLQDTLFIDNETRKYVHNSKNCLVIPEMSTADIITGSNIVLTQLTIYLEQMNMTAPADVATHLSTTPPKFLVPHAGVSHITKSIEHFVLSDEERSMVLKEALKKMNVKIHSCTMQLNHIEGSHVHLSDFNTGVFCVLTLPIPPTMRIDSKIALSRLLQIPCSMRFTLKMHKQDTDQPATLEIDLPSRAIGRAV